MGIPDYDEEKERKLFEAEFYSVIPKCGICFSKIEKKYISSNSRDIEIKMADTANLYLKCWLNRAKLMTGIQP